ncbi:hypothetical protein M514_06121, partial [Trichuris suis]
CYLYCSSTRLQASSAPFVNCATVYHIQCTAEPIRLWIKSVAMADARVPVKRAKSAHTRDQRSSADLCYDISFRVMMVGDCSVGKTCLLMRFAEGKFESEKYVTTIGIDYSSKVVQVGDVKVKLQVRQVWDTAGQERFRSLTKAYYRDSDCLLLLFDLTNPDSFHSCGQWLDDIRKYSPERSSVFLVGCKADLQDNRQIKFEVAKRLANAYNLMYFETSSRTGENVELLFDVIARQLLKKNVQHIFPGSISLRPSGAIRNVCCSYS